MQTCLTHFLVIKNHSTEYTSSSKTHLYGLLQIREFLQIISHITEIPESNKECGHLVVWRKFRNYYLRHGEWQHTTQRQEYSSKSYWACIVDLTCKSQILASCRKTKVVGKYLQRQECDFIQNVIFAWACTISKENEEKDLKTSKLPVVLIIGYGVDFQPAHSLGRNIHFRDVRVH